MKPSELLRAARDRIGTLAKHELGRNANGRPVIPTDTSCVARCVRGAVLSVLNRSFLPGYTTTEVWDAFKYLERATDIAAPNQYLDEVGFNNDAKTQPHHARGLCEWAAALAERDGR